MSRVPKRLPSLAILINSFFMRNRINGFGVKPKVILNPPIFEYCLTEVWNRMFCILIEVSKGDIKGVGFVYGKKFFEDADRNGRNVIMKKVKSPITDSRGGGLSYRRFMIDRAKIDEGSGISP
ncbi:MAG: hypothetical protein RMJ07_06115 [Nitrososphaerota archaeon]|nr:hypothetical protein [Candidatus Bathyarchaeota archaeon]MDW8049234.1 hypothetical protein [Nitrososphaerota archaeon]